MDAKITQIIAIFGAVVALGNVIVAYLTSRASARKSDIEALTQTVESLAKENKRLIERIEVLELQRQKDKDRIETLEEQVQALEEQVRALGAKPITESSTLWKHTHGRDRE